MALMLAALTLGCAKMGVDTKDPRTWGPRKTVWVYVAPLHELGEACLNGTLPPTAVKAVSGLGDGAPTKFEPVDVLVPEELLTGELSRPRIPFSCVDKEFSLHGGGDHPKTLIKLKKNPAESAVFRSSEKSFRLAGLKGEEGNAFPFDPNVLRLPTSENTQHETGPIVIDIGLFEKKKYKFTLRIKGYPVDPDLECRKF
ncbi:MAG TPA: hypothetical protein VHJ77_21445 [Vicinamibacterales bacterium]|nr:hypothetical protein [Vicinamibacterales bacterium]